MERKLVKQGRNALTVTLPAKWTQQKGLEAGDSVYIAERSNDLVVSSRLSAAKTSITVDLRDAERSAILHVITGKYIEGYDTITVHHNAPHILQDMTRRLIGTVIEEHSATKTVIKSIIAVPEENFDAILRRAAYLFMQQARTLELMTQGKATLEQLKTEEKLLDDNLLYCLRYLTKYETSHSYRYFLICATIEQAADQVSRIAQFIGKDKELAAIIVKGVEDYVRLLFSNEFKKLYTSLRAFRQAIPTKTFVQGLASTLAEILYNYIGYIVEY